MKKILVLYTSIGLGHKYIALNMASFLRENNFEVVLFDALELEKGQTTEQSEKLFLFLYRNFPFVWKWLYVTNWFISLTLPLRILAARYHYKKIFEVVKKENPDIILSTQTSPSAVIDYLKRSKKFTGKFVVTFSDFHLHRFWLYPNVDFYLANTIEQKNEMVNLGISPDKISVCGITIAPLKNVDASQVKNKLGMSDGQKLVVFASGSLGELMPVELIEEMKKISVNNIPIKLAIICGKNISLTKQLQEKYSGDLQISVFGFYEPLQELMAAADVLVSKPGGLTMIESLYWGVPMIVTHFLPGQEELNIEYLTKRGLVTLCLEKNPDSLTQIIHQELISKELRTGLQSNKFREELVSKSLGKSVVDAMNNIA
jgi:processive 1,2-diacylglycerol beta-glucosyltransferase